MAVKMAVSLAEAVAETGVAEQQDELKRSFKHTAFFSSLESAMP